MSGYVAIGTPGRPWSAAEKRKWFESRVVQRSYRDEVLSRVDVLDGPCEVVEYGSLSLDPERYPLRAVTIPARRLDAPWVLITGGVHGYETSGVQGAIRWLSEYASNYRDRANLVVVPCVSPWGYEVIDRWNPACIDPNRSFVADSPAEEAGSLMGFVDQLGVTFFVHMDLHETTDSDESQFRPAMAARDGEPFEPGSIPDGFYAVDDTENPQPEFQAAIIAGVARITHIALPDDDGRIIGTEIDQHGVISYANRALGLCTGMTQARYTTTTEVYPDSATTTPEICIQAQIAAVCTGLDFALGPGI